MPTPKEKPVAFRFKKAELKARFEAYMQKHGLNANQAVNRLIEDGLDAPARALKPLAVNGKSANQQAQELAAKQAQDAARMRGWFDPKGKK